jgi:hypothetical protein
MELSDQKWYEDQFDLFATQGWKDFVRQAEDIFESMNEVEGISTPEQLYRAKGVLENLRWITSWEESVLRTYKELTGE